jgi:hypothetical protein
MWRLSWHANHRRCGGRAADIERSTRLWQQDEDSMRVAVGLGEEALRERRREGEEMDVDAAAACALAEIAAALADPTIAEE